MKAIVITRPGGPEVLQLQERLRPEPAAHEVLIKVRATGLNRSDIALREGKYGGAPVAGIVPGLEVAGEVVAVGAAAPRWRVGDKTGSDGRGIRNDVAVLWPLAGGAPQVLAAFLEGARVGAAARDAVLAQAARLAEGLVGGGQPAGP